MSICEMPNEMLRKIAGNLDRDSLASLACVNRRFRDVFAEFLEPLRSDVLSNHLLMYLTSSESTVRSLDLSNCQAPADQLEYVIICNPNLVELHLMNTSLTFPDLWSVLPMLKSLEKLSFSVLSTSERDAWSFTHAPEGLVLPTIKELDVEVVPCYWTMDLIIDIINRCESIERIHVNVVGFNQEIRRKFLTVMKVERWRTLQTVVITDILAGYSLFTDLLLSRIFEGEFQPKGLAWAYSRRESFIHHKGWRNCEPGENQAIAPNADWLKAFARINIAPLKDFEDFRRLPCDKPRSLRLGSSYRMRPEKISLATEIIQCLSASLVELDLTDCHGVFSKSSRLTLFSSLKSLETLAVCVCLIGPTLRNQQREQVQKLTPEDREAFANVFREMKLKKLYIFGNNVTAICMSKPTLPRLEDFRSLEELSLSEVRLSNSTHLYISNSTVRTIRLNLDWHHKYENFRNFVQLCPSLENLSLLSASMELDKPQVWDGIDACENLKRLCLRSDQRDSTFLLPMQRGIARILPRLEVLHLHLFCFAEPGSSLLVENIRDLEVFQGFKGLFVGATKNRTSQAVPARTLCQLINFIGQAKPRNWD